MRSWQIAKRLQKTFEVTVLTAHEDSLPHEQHFSGVRVIHCGPAFRYTFRGSLWKRFLLMLQLYREAIHLKPDIIDAQSFIAYIPAVFAARKLKVPRIATCHDVWKGRWIQIFGIMGYIGELYERFYLHRRWTHFIANSNYTKNNLIKAGIVNSDISVVYNGVDLDTLRQLHVEKFSKPTVCSITRLVPYKRVGDLVAAIAQVKRDIPSVQCLIIGTGPERKKLEAEVIRLGLQNNIRLLGFINAYLEVIRVLKQSHVFCLPSAVEGFGIVIAEAMACGIPVVATNIEPIAEVTRRGLGAQLVEAGDREALARALTAFLKNDQQYGRYVKAATDIVQNYTWDRMAQLTANVYTKVAFSGHTVT
ncbi:MAG: glycosyltransferase family 4 protein [Patescibacteria group bacterium]